MGLITAILDVLIAIPAIAGFVERAVSAVVAWFLGRAKQDVLASLANAAARSARAETFEQRIEGARLWRDALSKSRFVP
jgi:hypothetical protein